MIFWDRKQVSRGVIQVVGSDAHSLKPRSTLPENMSGQEQTRMLDVAQDIPTHDRSSNSSTLSARPDSGESDVKACMCHW